MLENVDSSGDVTMLELNKVICYVMFDFILFVKVFHFQKYLLVLYKTTRCSFTFRKPHACHIYVHLKDMVEEAVHLG